MGCFGSREGKSLPNVPSSSKSGPSTQTIRRFKIFSAMAQLPGQIEGVNTEAAFRGIRPRPARDPRSRLGRPHCVRIFDAVVVVCLIALLLEVNKNCLLRVATKANGDAALRNVGRYMKTVGAIFEHTPQAVQ